MPSSNRPPGPGNGGMVRFVLIMAAVLLGLFLFFRWNYQVNTSQPDGDSAPLTSSVTLPLV